MRQRANQKTWASKRQVVRLEAEARSSSGSPRPWSITSFITNTNTSWQNYSSIFFALGSILLYMNSLWGEFVMDDTAAIVQNMDLRPNDVPDWLDLFRHDYWGTPVAHVKSHKSYRPFTVLTFRWNYMLSGLNPVAFHLTNVFLHAVVCLFAQEVLQSLLLLQITPMVTATDQSNQYPKMVWLIITMAWFVCHPIHTESVASIVGRAELLAAVFFFASFLCYTRSLWTSSSFFSPSVHINFANFMEAMGWYGASVFFALAAMLSKESGITILGIACALDVFELKKKWRKDRRELQEALMMSAAATIIRCSFSIAVVLMCLWTRKQLTSTSFGPTFALEDNYIHYEPTWSSRVLSYAYLHSKYAWLLMYPWKLSCDYSYQAFPLVTSWSDFRNVYSFCLYGSLAIGFVGAGWKNHTLVFSGLLFMVIPFLPSSNIFFPVATVVGERLLFLPSFGFCILVATFLTTVYHQANWGKKIIPTLCVGMLLGFSYRTITRNEDWRNAIALFKSAAETVPTSCKAHLCLAAAYLEKGEYTLALQRLNISLSVKPDYASAYFVLGNTYQTLNASSKATWAFTKAVEHSSNQVFKPDVLTVTLNNLGTLYMRSASPAQRQLSIDYFLQAIEIDPERYSAHANVAEVYAANNQIHEAIDHYRKAIALKEVADVHNNLGIALYRQAISHLRRPPTFEELGPILWHYRRGVELESTHVNSHENLAKVYIHFKKHDEAILQLKQLVNLVPQKGLHFYQLAREFHQQRKFNEALHNYNLAQQANDQSNVNGKKLDELIQLAIQHEVF